MALRTASTNSYLDAALEAVEARLGLPTPPPVKRHVGFSGTEEEERTPTEYVFRVSFFFNPQQLHLSVAFIRLRRPLNVV